MQDNLRKSEGICSEGLTPLLAFSMKFELGKDIWIWELRNATSKTQFLMQ